MGLIANSIITGLMGATVISAQCTGPAANSATVDLIAEFEGFSADICTSRCILTQSLVHTDLS